MDKVEGMRIADRICDLRKHLGLTREDFSELIDIPFGTYINYEGYTRSPGSQLLVNLAKNPMTRKNLVWIMTGKGHLK